MPRLLEVELSEPELGEDPRGPRSRAGNAGAPLSWGRYRPTDWPSVTWRLGVRGLWGRGGARRRGLR